ncbi:MAG: M3 family metallopeptidase, partial [Nocardioidaceae bacterium]
MPLTETNPFASPSTLPFAFPPFDLIRHEHYRPAFDAGVAEHRAEVEAIATNPEPATFANTFEALERSGRLLERVMTVFWNLSSSMADEAMQELTSELNPLYSSHQDEIRLDPRLFARIDAVHEQRHDLGLTPEQVRLVERYHLDHVRAGAGLEAQDRDRLRALNDQISALTTDFEKRLLNDTNDAAVQVSDEADLEGLPDDAVAAAKSAASD